MASHALILSFTVGIPPPPYRTLSSIRHNINCSCHRRWLRYHCSMPRWGRMYTPDSRELTRTREKAPQRRDTTKHLRHSLSYLMQRRVPQIVPLVDVASLHCVFPHLVDWKTREKGRRLTSYDSSIQRCRKCGRLAAGFMERARKEGAHKNRNRLRCTPELDISLPTLRSLVHPPHRLTRDSIVSSTITISVTTSGLSPPSLVQ